MKTFRRILSIFMAVLMTAAVASDVLANIQNPVINFIITDWTPRTDTTYTMELQWRRPAASSFPDNSAIPADRAVLHNPSNYDVIYRNASTSESYNIAAPNFTVDGATTADPAGPDPISLRLSNQPLTDASFYAFMIRPYHYHTYQITDANGNVTTEPRAVYPTGTTAETLYLTDIKVSGIGSGNKMTLVWDNPKIDGTQVFTGYRIYYEQGGSANDKIPNIPPIDVHIDDPGLIFRPDGKIEYTVTDDNLKIATFYAVKVEPLIGNTLFRTMSTVTVNSKTYNVSYPSMDREYRVNDVYISPALYVEPQGSDLLKIYWDTLKSLNGVTQILVQSSSGEEFTLPTTIGTLTGDTAATVTQWLTTMPATKTFYRLLISYRDGNTIITKPTLIVSYDPTYNEFSPYKPEILEYTSSQAPLTLNVKWEAFTRDPYNAGEEAAKNPDINKYVDKDMIYDIWISDNLAALDNANFQNYTIVPPIDASTLAEMPFPTAFNIEKLCYEYSFTEYYALNEDGSIVKKPLEQNKIYYIKIKARRHTGQESQSAYSSHYLQATDDVSPIPQMAAKPPLRIKKDENGTLVIDSSSITIQWDRRWFEAYNEADKTWYSQIGWDASGNILFGDQSAGNNQVNLFDSMYTGIINDSTTDPIGTIRNTLAGIPGAPAALSTTLPLRLIDLKDAQYEIHVTEYDKMLEAGSYESYYNMLVNDNSLWTQQITPDADSDPLHPHYKVTVSDNPAGNLQNNTAYVIFFRPYITVDDKKQAWFPNYVGATTVDTRDPIEITPTVPVLIPVEQTEMSLTVKWEYTNSLNYELAYGDTLSKYPDGGTSITQEQIFAKGKPVTEDGVTYYYYTIEPLFPETPYYIWIRSSAVNSIGTVFSQWSNPILMKTLELSPPEPPRGLGLVSKDNLAAYNTENTTDLLRLDSNYMILEWMKDFQDKSENAAASGDPQALLSPSFIDSYVARIMGLDPNTDYYIRAKTILTVTRSGDGIPQRVYNYYIEVSSDPYFEDAEKIKKGYVPALTIVTPSPGTDIRKESGWSQTIVIKTGRSGDDYDTAVDEKTYPLPIQDFEVIYDAADRALRLRFRTNQVDAAGNHDNSADQRFISSLIANQTSIYALDLSSYNNQPVSARILELPYSIAKTFDDRKIPLQLKAGGISVVFMPGSFNTAEILELKDYGKNAMVVYTITQNPGNAPALAAGEGYAANPQRISVQIITPSRTITMPYLSAPMQISLAADGSYSQLDSNIGVYTSDSNSGGWQRMDANYSSSGGMFSFTSARLGNYSAIARQLPRDEDTAQQSDAAYNIMTRLDIRDMQTYKGSDYITANQINNLIAAIAKGSSSLNINDSMSREDYESLGKAGYLITGTTVQRQVGIHTLVRLYELKTKTAISSFSDQRSSPYKDISLADQKYMDSLLKAGDLGFFGNSADANPRALLTISDTLSIIDIIMGDSGM